MASQPAEAAGPRLIKRYANRKLYDTGSGTLTSMRQVASLVHAGVDIRVVDHDTGEDMTGEVLVGILGTSISDRTMEADILLLTSLIRDPGDVLRAVTVDHERAEDLKAMRERVRLLSATIDALLGQMEETPAEEEATAPPPKPARKPAPAKRARTAGTARTPR
jgi:polyhydroxyalkanoate synthesis repressor PhaR